MIVKRKLHSDNNNNRDIKSTLANHGKTNLTIRKKHTNMTTISMEHQQFKDKHMSFRLSATNIKRIVNLSISYTMELVIMDSDALYTDGDLGFGSMEVMTGQGMKIKALWGLCRNKYELGKRTIDVSLFENDLRAN